MFNFNDIFTSGQPIEFDNEQYILIRATSLKTNQGHLLYEAIKTSDGIPAQVYLVPWVKNTEPN